MTNFFYFDQSGQKFGPINDVQLKALAAQGTITPQTPLEADTGHKGQAGQIPGLFVTPASASPFAGGGQQPAVQNVMTGQSLHSLKKNVFVGLIVLWVLCMGIGFFCHYRASDYAAQIAASNFSSKQDAVSALFAEDSWRFASYCWTVLGIAGSGTGVFFTFIKKRKR